MAAYRFLLKKIITIYVSLFSVGAVIQFKLNQFIKYTLGTSLVLSIKLLSQFFLEHGFDPKVAYAIVHVITLLSSYLYHVRITFSRRLLSFASFWAYAKSVALIKLLDYSIFFAGSQISENSYLLILASSGLIFILRFLFMKFFLEQYKQKISQA